MAQETTTQEKRKRGRPKGSKTQVNPIKKEAKKMLLSGLRHAIININASAMPLEKIIEEKIKLISYITDILDDAAYAEKFISKPHNRNCPSMYKILDYCYDKKDLGFYDKPKLVLRATPRQMTRDPMHWHRARCELGHALSCRCTQMSSPRPSCLLSNSDRQARCALALPLRSARVRAACYPRED